jgi:hypothetical protein
MKTNENLKKEEQFAIREEPALSSKVPGVFSRIGRPLKIFVYATSLAGIGLLFNSCMAGYAVSEPAYVEYSRPPRPNNLSIWIDGDWGWNNQSHVYVQRSGNWQNPRQGHSYVSGHWQEGGPRGKSWSKGHWQSEDRQRNDRER